MRPAVRNSLFALLALATVFVAARAAMFSASFALTRTNPEVALSLDDDNPDAIIRRAERLTQTSAQSAGNGDRLFAAARDSIAILPLNAPAFRLFASSSASSKEVNRFKALVAMSDRLSRRDLATQLFMIESAVQDDDVTAALNHYDSAMRIRKSSRALLLPMLSSAIKSPAIRAHLRPYLKTENPWFSFFIRQAVLTTPNPEDAVALVVEMGGMPEGDFYRLLNSQLMGRLVDERKVDAALRYYRALDGADPAILTSLSLSETSTNALHAPMAWQRLDFEGVESMFVTTDDGQYEVLASIEPGYNNAILRKVTALAPGRYHLSVLHRADDIGRDSDVRWRVQCLGAEESGMLLDDPVQIESEFVVDADFDVPEGCKMQLVTVYARIGNEPRDPVLTISSPKLAQR